ncbi:tetraspanin-10 [Ochotona princeps]|uniref:tetraspanin-10 n=1 Tax=Ochotona princeps TaxID=9978 RepID=UPI002714AB0C|nr:tetraspanin-10 [Ochotona princeps]
MAAAAAAGLAPRAAAGSVACRPAGPAAPASTPASRRRRHRRSSFAARPPARPTPTSTSGASPDALRRPLSPQRRFRPQGGLARLRGRGAGPAPARPRADAVHPPTAHADQLGVRAVRDGIFDAAGGRKPHLFMDSTPTSSHTGLHSPEDKAGARGCRHCPARGRGQPQRPLPVAVSCLKYLIFLSNFLFSLLALLALAVGLWGLTVKGSLGSDLGRPLPAGPMLGLVLSGLAVSAVSLAGCLGALCEHAGLLCCFSWGVFAFLGLEALAGALLLALWGPLQSGLELALRVAITHYQDEPDLHFLLDQVQLGLQCCGVVSYQDWRENPDFNCSSPGVQACSLPASCCVDPREGGTSINNQCGTGVLRQEEAAARKVVYLDGCGPRLRQWLHSSARALGSFLIAVALVQGTELLMAMQLAWALTTREGELARPDWPVTWK